MLNISNKKIGIDIKYMVSYYQTSTNPLILHRLKTHTDYNVFKTKKQYWKNLMFWFINTVIYWELLDMPMTSYNISFVMKHRWNFNYKYSIITSVTKPLYVFVVSFTNVADAINTHGSLEMLMTNIYMQIVVKYVIFF